MTCIVGIAEQGRVYLGGDSAGVSRQELTLRADSKIFRVQDFLIGCTWSFRMSQLLQYRLQPPAYSPKEGVERYLCTHFMDEVRRCFKEGGCARKEHEAEAGGTFLLGFRGRIFTIYSDYQLSESLDGYQAIGTGDEVALGVLYATAQTDMAPKERLALALQAASHHIISVAAPFHFLDSQEEPR